jgi:hypothetical protein
MLMLAAQLSHCASYRQWPNADDRSVLISASSTAYHVDACLRFALFHVLVIAPNQAVPIAVQHNVLWQLVVLRVMQQRKRRTA